MSGIRIGSNISSLQAQRSLAVSSEKLSSTYERLSSGLRINRASDDAAGLAVSSSLLSDRRIYNQAVRNLNDGLSVLRIADGAIESLSNITIRLQELAEQAANGSLGTSQRKSLDEEAQALSEEYFRISRATSFNGLRLLDGSIQGLRLQAGYGTDGSILSSLGGKLGTGTFSSESNQYAAETLASYALAVGDLNGDGILDMVTAGDGGAGLATVHIGIGDGTFSSDSNQYATESGQSNAIALSDMNGDGVLDMVTTGAGAVGKFTTVRLGTGDGTFSSSVVQFAGAFVPTGMAIADLNNDGVQDLVETGSLSGKTWASIHIGNGDGTFRASISYEQMPGGALPYAHAVSLADLNGDGITDLVTTSDDDIGPGNAVIRLGNGDGTFKSALSYWQEDLRSYGLSLSDLNGDGIVDMVTAGENVATVRLGNGDGSFRKTTSYTTGEISYAVGLADLNGDGSLDLVTAGSNGGVGRVTVRLGVGDGTFSSTSTQYSSESNGSYALSLSDLNQDGVVDLVTAGQTGGGGGVTTRLSDTQDGTSPHLPFDL